ncbi:MAG: hypothetical protein NVS3B18_16250 [Candidatus Dormibacteria bacterium]
MTTENTTTRDQPLGYRLAHGVFAVYNALIQSVVPLLTELELTRSLADTLWQLEPDDGPLPRGVLAERLNCDPSNVTFLVDRLEDRGLVERSEHPGDRRVKAVKLTPAGLAARRRLVAATVDAPAFARLSPAQQRQLADLLARCACDPALPTPGGPTGGP